MKTSQQKLLIGTCRSSEARVGPGVVAALFCLAVLPASANEFGGTKEFRLSDPSNRVVRSQLLDLRERKEGGAFVYNTTIERQYNCTQSVAATGNAAQPSHSGVGISPIGFQNSGVNATTTGNQSTANTNTDGVGSSVSVSGTFSPEVSLENGASIGGPPTAPNDEPILGGSPIILEGQWAEAGPVNANAPLGNGGSIANGGNVNQVGQANTGSQLNSDITGSPLTAQIGDIDATGAQILNSLHNEQSNQDSQIMASAENSQACSFMETAR